jgi:hypothetical protein
MWKYNDYKYKENKMKLEKSIILHVTEDAKKKWEGKEKSAKRKNGCPSCEIEELKKNIVQNQEILNDELLND